MAEQKHNSCFQNLIQKVVIILAGQYPLSGETVLYGPRHIDFATNNGYIFFAIQILTI